MSTASRRILAWLDAERMAEEAAARADALKEAARTAPFPTRLRPAVAADVVEGAVLWYPDGNYWKLVGAVHDPSDPYKAYSSHDGDRYGLHGAFVETDVPAAVPVASFAGTVDLTNEKRCYVPGVVIEADCPKCGHRIRRDMTSHYLSYPRTGVWYDAALYCVECDHEIPIEQKLDVLAVLSVKGLPG